MKITREHLDEIELELSEHKRLHKELNDILHPNGDKPENPSLCDLVAYVEKDLKTLKAKLSKYEDGSTVIKDRTSEFFLRYKGLDDRVYEVEQPLNEEVIYKVLVIEEK